MPRTWTVWGVEAALDVTLPAVAAAAERIVHSVTDDVDRACSRFRSDSELSLLGPQLAEGARLSPTLRTLVEAALDAGDAIDSALRAITKGETVRYWQKIFGPTFNV